MTDRTRKREVLKLHHENISAHLNAIRMLFKDPGKIRISLVIRPNDDPDQADYVTNDETEYVIAAIRYLEASRYLPDSTVELIDTRSSSHA